MSVEHITSEDFRLGGGEAKKIFMGKDEAPNLHRHYVYSAISPGAPVHQSVAHFTGQGGKQDIDFVDPAIHCWIDKTYIKRGDEEYVYNELVVVNYATGTARDVHVDIGVLV